MTGTTTCRLTWDHRGNAGEFVLAHGRAVLGRSPQCDLVLADDSLSRRHAEVAATAEGFEVRDLGSLNGVLLNGKRVPDALLADGDVVQVGDVCLRVAIADDPLAVPVHFDDTPLPATHDDLARAATGDAPMTLDVGSGATLSLGPGEGAGLARSEATATGLVRPLREAAQVLLAGRDLEDTLRRFLRLVARDLGAERGCIGLLDPRTGLLEPRASWAAGRWLRQPITISRAIAQGAITQRRGILVRDAGTDARFADAQSVHALQIRSAMCAPLLHAARVEGVLYVDTRGEARPFTETDLQALSILATLAAVAIEEARLRDAIAHEQALRARLSRYSSPAVVDEILRGDAATDEGMRCAEREISILFADFAGFTAFAAERSPLEVSRTLNGAFDVLCRAVFAAGGTLDKFTGDGLMAFFGAPAAQPDHALRAVRAALAMQAAMATLRAGGLPLDLRIGIETGPAIVGDIGTRDRRDYTAIGAAVNLAARLEHGVAAPGQIAIGPRTQALVAGAATCTPLAPCQVKGFAAPVQAFLVTAVSA